MRKKSLLFLLLFPAYLCAQNRKIDSIDNLISNAKTDTARINQLLNKSALLSNINLDSAILLTNKIIQDAKKAGYRLGYAKALTYNIGYYSYAGNFDKARPNLTEAEDIYKQLNDTKELANHYNAGYGIFYGMQSKYDSGATWFLKAIAIGEVSKDSVLLASAWQNIAIGYYMQSNFPAAVSYQQKALNYYEIKNDLDGQAKVLVNMGNAYCGAGDTLRAEQSFRRTIAITGKTGNQRIELYAYKNLATLIDGLKQNDSVYSISIRTAALAKKTGDRSIEASSFSLAAQALARQDHFYAAELLNTRAIALADSAAVPYNAYQVYAGMGIILEMQAKYKPAIEYFEKAFLKLKNTDFYEPDIGGNYEILSRCYEKTNAPVKALEAFKTFNAITDSVRRKDNVRKLTELSLNYDFNKKQQEADLEQQKKNATKNAQQLALLVILGATIILAAVAFAGYRNKQKANTLLNQQKEEIQTTLTQLKAAQAHLIQSEKMASLGELTAGIAHEIQNPLNFVNNFSELNTELIEELKAERDKTEAERNAALENDLMHDIEQNMEKIAHHGKRAGAIVKGMLQHAQKSSGQKVPTDINKLADEYLRLAYRGLRAKDKDFNATIKTDFDESISNINIIPQDIGRVLLNLYNNAFYAVAERKKAQPDYEPLVTVSTIGALSFGEGRGEVKISVKDNGGGIPKNIVDKIFQPFFTTKPTGQGTGLGLSLSYDIVKAQGGDISVQTKEGEGATFSIQLPVG